jgi:hypothetical protein
LEKEVRVFSKFAGPCVGLGLFLIRDLEDSLFREVCVWKIFEEEEYPAKDEVAKALPRRILKLP